MLPSRTFILGGARSGKSAFAERLAERYGRPAVYLATAQPLDAEMRDRIAAHKSRRGELWRTIEEPLAVAERLRGASATEVLLLDCATLWLSNQMFAENDLGRESSQLVTAFADCAAPVIVVSNEVGLGLVPDNTMGRKFRDAQGRLNQRLAACAELAVLVVSGLPVVLKGRLPEGLT